MKRTNLLYLAIFCLIIVKSSCIFSKYYRKCKLFKNNSGIEVGQLKDERVTNHKPDFYIEPLIQTAKTLQYKQIDYYYVEYIGAGGSGEVYLVQDLRTNQAKVLKRFFRQKRTQFKEQNFIMHKMNYTIEWLRDYQNGIPKKTDYFKDRADHDVVPTIAVYDYKQSLTLRDVQFFPRQGAQIFYKIIKELEKTHKNSIIHNDLKMGNIMVNSLGHNFKFFQTQLIDWNLAQFYYLGLQINTKKGTVCYYSPQQLLRSAHITPAIDVWALAVVMWTFYTDEKPFYTDCKKNNLKAIASLVGMQKLIQLYKKYHYPYFDDYYQLLQKYIKHPNQYKPHKLKSLVPQNLEDFFTDDLLDIFERMLTPDPEERITVSQLLQHNYFKNMKKIPSMYEQKRKADEQKKKKKQSEQKQGK